MSRLVHRPTHSTLQCSLALLIPAALALGACASNPVSPPQGSGNNGGGSGSNSGGSGSPSGSGSTSSSGTSAGNSGSTGGGSSGGYYFMTASGSTNETVNCSVPSVSNVGSLPLAVDTYFKPTGWMGDAPAWLAIPADQAAGTPAIPARSARMQLFPVGYSSANNDACSNDVGSRSSSNAKGTCWKVVYTPFPQYCTPYGWAGAFWQYPNNNFGAGAAANNASGQTVIQGGGFPVPATPNNGPAQVSFWARGLVGGEHVKFFSGEGGTFPCSDFASGASTIVVLTQTWTHYTVDLTGFSYSVPTGSSLVNQPGNYFGGVLGAFGFGVGDQIVSQADGGMDSNNVDHNDAGCDDPQQMLMGNPPNYFYSNVTFYIDDIEWQAQ